MTMMVLITMMIDDGNAGIYNDDDYDDDIDVNAGYDDDDDDDDIDVNAGYDDDDDIEGTVALQQLIYNI
jgi:hypothetical protein